MNISFINATLGGDYSALDIAITTLASYVNAKSAHSASIIDLTFHRKDWQRYLKRQITQKQPDVIAISTNTMYMQYVRAVIAFLKANYDIPILLGGHHASIYPDETISLSECDYLAIGDGEDITVRFLDRMARGENMNGVRGIWEKQENSILKNPKEPFRENLDDIPLLEWSLWDDLDDYFYFLGMLYLIGSRGCPYRCTYCDALGIADAIGGPYFRLRDPRQYARELMEYADRYRHPHLKLLQLFDPVFTIKKEWVETFSDEYSRGGVKDKLPFSVFSRIDHLNEDVIPLLARANCRIVRVGIETGDECTRHNIYNKKIDDTNIENIFTLLKKHGIHATAYYILGGPNESKVTINKTLSMARKLDAARSAFFIYKPFTEEGRKQIIEYGGHIDEKRWAKADNITFQAVVYSKDLTPREIERFQIKAYFFTFGKRLLRILRREKWRYPVWFVTYLVKGIKRGMSLSYLSIYFHIYGYDNVDK